MCVNCQPANLIAVPRRSGDRVHIVYIDDSKQDKEKEKQFQVMAAVIVADDFFASIEQELAYRVYEQIPLEIRDTCELHAVDLWQGNNPFDGIPQDERRRLFGQSVTVIENWNIPIVYGAVDLRKLQDSEYGSANAADVAFRRCARAIESWFHQNGGFGLLIADNTKDQSVRRAMLEGFRQYRQFVRSSPPTRGLLQHIHDDMYFGDSKFSVGIQLADVCALLISRHLAEYRSTQDFYARIEPLIFKGIAEAGE